MGNDVDLGAENTVVTVSMGARKQKRTETVVSFEELTIQKSRKL